MIQRIQSLWLVLAVCCMALCFMFPVAEYHMDMPTTHQTAEAQLDLIAKDNPEMMNQMLNLEPTVGYSQKASGFRTWPLLLVNLLTVAMALVCIFLYKNRVMQASVWWRWRSCSMWCMCSCSSSGRWTSTALW